MKCFHSLVIIRYAWLLAVLTGTAWQNLPAQNLGFGRPVNFLPGARSDKALDITQFKKGFFVTWKSEGAAGAVCIAYLGKQNDTSFKQRVDTIAGEQTAFAPVLRVLGNNLYVLWIGADGTVKYAINHSDTSIDTKKVQSMPLGNDARLTSGITSAAVGNRLVVASHGAGKDQLVIAVLDRKSPEIFEPAALQTIPAAGSTDYPFVVALGDSAIRVCYRGFKKQDLYYTDYHLHTQQWTNPQAIDGAASKVSPAIYSVFSADRLFYIWRGAKNDNRIHYAAANAQNTPGAGNTLPVYFTTQNPVSICTVDDNQFIMAYIGEDHLFYLSYFTSYNTASWMGDLLLPYRPNATLKDIVIPGSHDAGMSVLTAAGGMQSASVNECNTLTQIQPIASQLNAGIRMFDLRVGTLNGVLYTKHCSSDCMSEAMGGAYGEKLEQVLQAVKHFLHTNTKEVVLLTFSHFCEKETPVKVLADSVAALLGKDILYRSGTRHLGELPLKELAGKVLVSFEGYSFAGANIDSCSIKPASKAFINFRRAYAATNDLRLLLEREAQFFTALKEGTQNNDLVRLDWQLTQSGQEAAMICNDFQDEKTSPLISGAMLLTNIIKKNQRIIDLARKGNQYLPAKVNEWISNGIINQHNKPNILYVDIAGAWITDYCIDLNETSLYKNK